MAHELGDKDLEEAAGTGDPIAFARYVDPDGCESISLHAITWRATLLFPRLLQGQGAVRCLPITSRREGLPLLPSVWSALPGGHLRHEQDAREPCGAAREAKD